MKRRKSAAGAVKLSVKLIELLRIAQPGCGYKWSEIHIDPPFL